MGYLHKSEQGRKTTVRGVRTEGNQIHIALTTVYATMQPGGPLSPSASMGPEWIVSMSEAFDVTVKRIAKESIVVWVWV